MIKARTSPAVKKPVSLLSSNSHLLLNTMEGLLGKSVASINCELQPFTFSSEG